MEYAQHLKTKITDEQKALAEHNSQLASLRTKTTTADIEQQREELEELVRSAQENISLYRELLEPVKMGVCEARNIWVPKSIGLLGRMPWIDLYGDWLRILLDGSMGVRGHRHQGPSVNIERYTLNFLSLLHTQANSIHCVSAVYNIIREVPLPPPGRFEIGLTINRRSLFFSRPPVNEVPLLKNVSMKYACLFGCHSQ